MLYDSAGKLFRSQWFLLLADMNIADALKNPAGHTGDDRCASIEGLERRRFDARLCEKTLGQVLRISRGLHSTVSQVFRFQAARLFRLPRRTMASTFSATTVSGGYMRSVGAGRSSMAG